MRLIGKLVIGLVGGAYLALATTIPADAQTIWTWKNQYGSTLAVNSFDTNTGALSGTYTNNAKNSCDEGKPQPMTGWLSWGTGTAISFAVNFAGCDSTTVWTGQLTTSADFQGLWLLSLAEPVAWNGISAGADFFKFANGDQTKLMKSADAAKAAGTGSEKLTGTKKK
ncbi:avidin [Rhodopseudomonas palustris]|uniref:Avidin n=1 Tax=Rhodopseudomonas palustris TaxID=1076 RepID=A0A323UAD5_RHOPL|nr:avidin/streptavidin family protein [Rhodopseudomonas palustris]PZA09179.1 avidin [Rhodopseudomonas palustris]